MGHNAETEASKTNFQELKILLKTSEPMLQNLYIDDKSDDNLKIAIANSQRVSDSTVSIGLEEGFSSSNFIQVFPVNNGHTRMSSTSARAYVPIRDSLASKNFSVVLEPTSNRHASANSQRQKVQDSPDNAYTDTHRGETTEMNDGCQTGQVLIVTSESNSVYRPTYTLGSVASNSYISNKDSEQSSDSEILPQKNKNEPIVEDIDASTSNIATEPNKGGFITGIEPQSSKEIDDSGIIVIECCASGGANNNLMTSDQFTDEQASITVDSREILTGKHAGKYQNNSNNSKEESSQTSSSSASDSSQPEVSLKCLRGQPLHTICEGNSSEVSDSQDVRPTSNFMRSARMDSSPDAQSTPSHNLLERMTRAKLEQRQSQLMLRSSDEGMGNGLISFGKNTAAILGGTGSQEAEIVSIDEIANTEKHPNGLAVNLNPALDLQLRISSPRNNNELHLTGDLLASNEESYRFAPDFSLEDPEISLRCPQKAVQSESRKSGSSGTDERTTEEQCKQSQTPVGQLYQKVLPLHPKTKSGTCIVDERSNFTSFGAIAVEKARNMNTSSELTLDPYLVVLHQTSASNNDFSNSTLLNSRSNTVAQKPGSQAFATEQARLVNSDRQLNENAASQVLEIETPARVDEGEEIDMIDTVDIEEANNSNNFDEKVNTQQTVFTSGKGVPMSGSLPKFQATRPLKKRRNRQNIFKRSSQCEKSKPDRNALRKQTFTMKLKSDQMTQLEGDSGLQMAPSSIDIASPFLDRSLHGEALELKHPETNEVFLRAPIAEADMQLRRLSNMVDAAMLTQAEQHKRCNPRRMTTQNSSSVNRRSSHSNENLTRSCEETDESMVFGQKTKVVQSILQKILQYQSQDLSKPVTEERTDGQKTNLRQSSHLEIIETAGSNDAMVQVSQGSSIRWSNQEMKALTQIFKDMVDMGGLSKAKEGLVNDSSQVPMGAHSCKNRSQRGLTHISNFSSDLSARNQQIKWPGSGSIQESQDQVMTQKSSQTGQIDASRSRMCKKYRPNQKLLETTRPQNSVKISNDQSEESNGVSMHDLQTQNQVLAMQVKVLQDEMHRIKRQLKQGGTTAVLEQRSTSNLSGGSSCLTVQTSQTNKAHPTASTTGTHINRGRPQTHINFVANELIENDISHQINIMDNCAGLTDNTPNNKYNYCNAPTPQQRPEPAGTGILRQASSQIYFNQSTLKGSGTSMSIGHSSSQRPQDFATNKGQNEILIGGQPAHTNNHHSSLISSSNNSLVNLSDGKIAGGSINYMANNSHIAKYKATQNSHKQLLLQRQAWKQSKNNSGGSKIAANLSQSFSNLTASANSFIQPAWLKPATGSTVDQVNQSTILKSGQNTPVVQEYHSSILNQEQPFNQAKQSSMRQKNVENANKLKSNATQNNCDQKHEVRSQSSSTLNLVKQQLLNGLNFYSAALSSTLSSCSNDDLPGRQEFETCNLLVGSRKGAKNRACSSYSNDHSCSSVLSSRGPGGVKKPKTNILIRGDQEPAVFKALNFRSGKSGTGSRHGSRVGKGLFHSKSSQISNQLQDGEIKRVDQLMQPVGSTGVPSYQVKVNSPSINLQAGATPGERIGKGLLRTGLMSNSQSPKSLIEPKRSPTNVSKLQAILMGKRSSSIRNKSGLCLRDRVVASQLSSMPNGFNLRKKNGAKMPGTTTPINKSVAQLAQIQTQKSSSIIKVEPSEPQTTKNQEETKKDHFVV